MKSINTKRILSLFSLFMMCLIITAGLMSCRSDEIQQSDVIAVTDGDGQSLNTNGELQPYRIVCRNRYSDAEMNAANSLRQQIGEATGVWLEITTDYEREGTEYVRTDYEILLGNTNREESVAVQDKYEKNKDYGIYKPSTRIVIVAGSDEALQTAVDTFVEKYVDGETKSVNIADGEAHEYRHEYLIDSLELD